MSPTNPLEVACPQCSAAPGRRCRGADRPHALRVAAFMADAVDAALVYLYGRPERLTRDQGRIVLDAAEASTEIAEMRALQGRLALARAAFDAAKGV